MDRKHFLATFVLGLCLAIPSTGLSQGKVLISSPADAAGKGATRA